MYVVVAGVYADQQNIATFTKSEDAEKFIAEYNHYVLFPDDQAWLEELPHYGGDAPDAASLFSDEKLSSLLRSLDLTNESEQELAWKINNTLVERAAS